MPVNFSLTHLDPTHIISAEADRAITLVTYQSKRDAVENRERDEKCIRRYIAVAVAVGIDIYTRTMTTDPGCGTGPCAL